MPTLSPATACRLRTFPVGTTIHNIELYPGKGAQLVRSAGVGAQLMAREGGKAMVRLPSGELRYVRLDCKATIGVAGALIILTYSWARLAVPVIWVFARPFVVL